MRSRDVRFVVARRGISWRVAVLAWLAVLASSAPGVSQTPRHRTFATPEEAVTTLIAVVKKGDLPALVALFGPDGEALVSTSDPATGRRNREVFRVAAAEGWRLEDAGAARKTLYIGYEDWPFPAPLVKQTAGWQFDTAAGKEEILARRIGRNELSTIGTCHAFVAAQLRYAQAGHDGQPAGAYATQFASDKGRQNGLYWPAVHGQPRSPLGDLVAEAAAEGTTLGVGRAPSPLRGYYFRILKAQGAAAPGGAKSYVADGRMTGGFALVAWPAKYDATGIMTFIVNQDGIVHEKDLGPKTDTLARALRAYDPDASWGRVP